MSDDVKGFVVVLAKDINEQKAELVGRMFSMLPDVISIEPIPARSLFSDMIIEQRTDARWRDAIFKMLKEVQR